MGQDDVFKRKHLSVLNRAAPKGSSEYVLDNAGVQPDILVGAPGELERQVIAALRTIHDPEIPLNIYDLGLVYRVAVDPKRQVEIDMTLTSPGCPVAGVLLRQTHEAVCKVPGVSRTRTELVWDPPWTKDRMSEAAQLALGLL